jgi:hypothetical protein
MNRELFIRNVEGSRVLYDVLSSSKTFYYTVEMLGLVAISCECDHYVKGHKHCKHQTTAEKAEQEFQQSKNQVPRAEMTDSEKRLASSLQGTRGFSLTR